MKIGVTGANGFVGRYLLATLQDRGAESRALIRSPLGLAAGCTNEIVAIPTLDRDTDPGVLRAALAGLDTVVHLAARVHVMDAALDEDAFQNVNVGGSGRLFEAAAAVGIKRFVYLSSIKAAGERSGTRPVTTDDPPVPEDAYGRSKLDAEGHLTALASGTGCELVILRPAFVYGWPPAGNFRTVISAILKGVPLPLAAIDNRRDMTYAGNLAAAIATACDAKGLQSTPYFISDGTPVSTPELFRSVATAFARPARLFSVPPGILRLGGTLTGRSAAVQRITEDFVIDTAPFRRDARWQPPYKMSEGLDAVAAAWRQSEQTGSV
jgi:nucleoside-diphosphate-sugar epimerase